MALRPRRQLSLERGAHGHCQDHDAASYSGISRSALRPVDLTVRPPGKMHQTMPGTWGAEGQRCCFVSHLLLYR